MTPASKDFVTPLTLSTLSKNAVHSTFFNRDDENEKWNNHVELGLWADIIIIAQLQQILCRRWQMVLAITFYLLLISAKCPVYFAPAMDLDMYKHPSTIATFKALHEFGNTIILLKVVN
jgi:phosphopantothenoylcysteine decarboxylase/phosphopantothenate--cysteine ligase